MRGDVVEALTRLTGGSCGSRPYGGLVAGLAAAVHMQPASGQLCFQRAILLVKERNRITLLAVEPSEQRGEEHL